MVGYRLPGAAFAPNHSDKSSEHCPFIKRGIWKMMLNRLFQCSSDINIQVADYLFNIHSSHFQYFSDDKLLDFGGQPPLKSSQFPQN